MGHRTWTRSRPRGRGPAGGAGGEAAGTAGTVRPRHAHTAGDSEGSRTRTPAANQRQETRREGAVSGTGSAGAGAQGAQKAVGAFRGPRGKRRSIWDVRATATESEVRALMWFVRLFFGGDANPPWQGY